MNKAERLFEKIGEIGDAAIIENIPKKKRRLPVLLTVGGACAAAVLALILYRSSGQLFPWEGEIKAVQPSLSSSDLPYGLYAQLMELSQEEPPPLTAELSPYNAGMGGDGGMAVPESSSPWNEKFEIEKLPVFYGNKRYQMIKPEDAVQKMRRVADIFGEELTDIEYDEPNPEYFDPEDREWVSERCSYVSAKAGAIKLTAYGHGCGGEIRIDFPAEDEPYSQEEIAKLLKFENPVCEEHDIGFTYHVVYEGSDDALTAILNYSFRCFDYRYEKDEYNFLMLTDNLTTLDCVGMYPILSAEEAKNELFEGNYSAMYPDVIENGEKNTAVCTGLFYRPNADGEYLLPFYSFSVKTDRNYGESFAACLVCAVSPQYLAADTDARFN